MGCTLCENVTYCTSCAVNFNLRNNLCLEKENTFLEELLVNLVENEGVTYINKIPGGRKALPFLGFLINIDELWLYQYHERNYGKVMNALF